MNCISRLVLGVSLGLVSLAHPARGAEPAPFDLAAIPSNASLALRIRPAELAGHDATRPLAGALDEILASQKLGIRSADLAEYRMIILGTVDDMTGQISSYTALRARDRHDWRPAMKAMFGAVKPFELEGRAVFQTNSGWDANSGDDTLAVYYWLPDDRTVVFGPRIALVHVLAGVEPRDQAAWHESWTAAAGSPLAFLLQTNLMPLVGLANIPEDADPAADTVSDPVMQDGRFLVLQGKPVPEGLELKVRVQCESAEGAARVSPALARSMTELANHLAASVDTGVPGDAAKLPEELGRLAAATRFRVDGDRVQIQALASTGLLRSVGAAMNASARLERLQEAARTRIAELAAALNKYHDAHGAYPEPVMLGSDGKTVYSWRVAILPYLEGGRALAARYRTNEPWDSDHNWQVMREGIDLFAAPSPREADDPTACGYYLVTGPGTVFDGQGRPTRDRISDGLQHTLLVVEARRNHPWTKPEDIVYSDDQPVPDLGGHFDQGFAVAMASGAARRILEIEDASLRAMITKDRNDTLVIKLEWHRAPARPR